MSNLNFALINGEFSPVAFREDTPNQVIYNVSDKLANLNIDFREWQKLLLAYPHLTPLVVDAHQFASNLSRLAMVEGVKASTYLKLSKI